MRKTNSKLHKLLIVAFATLLFHGCKSTDEGTTNNGIINLNLAPLFNEGESYVADLSEIDVFVFSNGTFTKRIKKTISKNKTISLDIDTKNSIKILLLTDPNQLTDYSNLTEGVSTEAELLSQKIDNVTTVKPFYVSSDKIEDMNNHDIEVTMLRGVARVDIEIEENSNIVVETVRITNLAAGTYVYPQTDEEQNIFKTMSFEKIFETPLTSSMENLCFLFAQGDNNSQLEIIGKIDGQNITAKIEMPQNIERDKIYRVSVTETLNIVEVEINIEEPGNGGDIDAEPNIGGVKIDVQNSTIPKEIRVSKTMDTIFIPSYNTTFKLALLSDSELEVVMEDDNIDNGSLTITPIADNTYLNNNYMLGTTSRTTKGVAYLNVRDKNLDRFYDDKIVIVLEKSKIEYTGELLKYFKPGGDVNFNKYSDGDWGTLKIPNTSTIDITNIPEWIKLEKQELRSSDYLTYKVLGGFRPNNMAENGVIQKYELNVIHKSGIIEPITVSRISNSLPVVETNGQYWCMYNLQGNARKFEDQILEHRDNLYAHLQSCSDQEFVNLMGDAYKGRDSIGMNLKVYKIPGVDGAEPIKKYSFENFELSNHPGYPGQFSKFCPDGYMIPERKDLDNIFKPFNNPRLPFFWESPVGRKEASSFSRINLIVDGEPYPHKIHVYYSKSTDESSRIVVSGLGFQENAKNKKVETYMSPIANGNQGYFWGFFNNRWRNDPMSHQLSLETTRYIRCLKEPGFFIY